MKVRQIIVWDVPGVSTLDEAAERVMGEFVDATDTGPSMESTEVHAL